MQKAESRIRRWWYQVIALIAVLVVTADQLTKLWIRTYNEGQVIWELGFIQIRSIRNTGVSFGLFQGHSSIIAIIVTIGVVLLIFGTFLVHRYFPYFLTRLNMAAFGLVIGGTLGNLIDRFRFGYITDFIDVGFWPVFNVADSAVTVTIVLIAFSLFFSAKNAS